MDSITPSEAQEKLAQNCRERRLQLNISQETLALRAGVKLPTLRTFEQKGRISLESFLKVKMVLGGLDDLVKSTEPAPVVYHSIEDVIKANKAAAPRKRLRSRRRA